VLVQDPAELAGAGIIRPHGAPDIEAVFDAQHIAAVKSSRRLDPGHRQQLRQDHFDRFDFAAARRSARPGDHRDRGRDDGGILDEIGIGESGQRRQDRHLEPQRPKDFDIGGMLGLEKPYIGTAKLGRGQARARIGPRRSDDGAGECRSGIA